MEKRKQFDCVGVGLCAIDYLCLVPDYPAANTKTEAVAYSRQGGGPIATAMVTLARLGAAVGFVGKVGADVEGEFVRAEFQWENVDYSNLIVDKTERTPQAFIWVDQKTGDRSIVLNRTQWTPPNWDAIDHAVFAGTKFLHVDGRFPELEIPAIRLAKSHGAKIVMDAGGVRKEMDTYFSWVDYFVASETFFKSYFKNTSLESGLKELITLGPRAAVVTLGNAGAMGADENGLVRTPAFTIPVIDTTGAGDVYHGAFIFGLLQGWSLEKTMIFSGAVAGLKCRRLGGRKGIPSLRETQDFLLKNGFQEFEAKL
ncbi:5-dehydro-2-deoxygluconokinase [bacterium BMS3Abin05]|nr:5-dehydro-2-deoxygluconokinase [bacterium BMS3Abin05]GBE27065.1 5-dehydro-2-deoxygluconokinase [bacterium BMS3Bbin03]HDZ12081.1 hypothetical protein [Bacteroidota bacterium]